MEVITPKKINSVSWTSGNIGNAVYYKRLPSQVIKIVDTLGQYTSNATLISVESRIKDKFEIKQEIIENANLQFSQKNFSQANVLYGKALEIDTGDVEALVNRAYSFIGLGQHANADLLIDKALNIQPVVNP